MSGWVSKQISWIGDKLQGSWDFVVDCHKNMLQSAFGLIGIEGKTVHVVSRHSQQLFPDAKANTIRKAIFLSVMEDTTLSKQILTRNITGIAANLRHMHAYGRDNYIHGLPTATQWNSNVDTTSIEIVIESVVGEAVTVQSAVTEPLDIMSWIRWWMQEVSAYPYVYHDHEIYYTILQYRFVSYTTESTYYDVYFLDQYDNNSINQYPPLIEDVSGPTDLWYKVVYELDSDPGIYFTWLYNSAEATYPSLIIDDVTNAAVADNLVIPIIPIRKNFININEDKDSEEYVSSRKMLNMVSVDLDATLSGINQNEDVSLVGDAFVLSALNLYTDTPGGKQAMYNLFTGMDASATVSKYLFESQVAGANSPLNTYSIIEQHYNVVLNFNWITIETHFGTLVDTGEIESDINIISNSTYHPASDYGDEWGDELLSQFILRKQISADRYEEIIVSGLANTTVILTTAGEAHVLTTIVRADTEQHATERTNFNIPLRLEQLAGLSIGQIDELVYESIRLSIYAKDSYHLEYYETTAFANFMFILTIVITIVVAVMTGGSGAQIITNIVKGLVYNAVLAKALEEILSHNIGDEAKVVAMFAYVWASYEVNAGLATEALLLPQQILLATNAVTSAMLIDQGVQFDDLTAAMRAFDNLMEDKDEELQEAFDGLKSDAYINVFDVVRVTQHDPYEPPEDFFQRTIHNTNPCVKALDQVGDYHTEALKLPEL